MAEFLAASLGPIDCSLLLWNESDLGSVGYEDEETQNIYADINTQLARRSSKLRELHLTIRLKGTSKDDLIARENALRAEIAKESTTLVLQPKGATLPVTFVVLRSPATVAPFDLHYEKANLGYYDVTLVCQPWALGDSVAKFTAEALTGPSVVELGTLEGQGDPRLALTVTAAGAAGLQFVCVALCPAGTVASDLVYQAETSDLDGFWYDYDGNANCVGTSTVITSSSVANPSIITCAAPHGLPAGTSLVVIGGHVGSTPSINGAQTATKIDTTSFSIPVNVTTGGTGGTVVRGHSARLDSADTTAWLGLNNVVPAASLPPGRYRVWARARATSGDEGYLAKRKQYSTGRDPSSVVTLDSTVLAWHDLGEWTHYGSDGLRLYGKAVSGGIYIDEVVLVPVDFGLVWYTDSSETTHKVRFGWLYDHAFTTVSAPTVEADATGRMQGHGIKAPREGYALFVFVEPAGSDPSPNVTLDASYFSRWEMFR